MSGNGVEIHAERAHGRGAAMALMGLDDHMFAMLIERNPDAFTLGQLVWDSAGAPVDAHLVFANDAFAGHAGMPGEALAGRRVTSVLDGVWLDLPHEVVTSREPAKFVRYQRESDRWYEVYVFPVGPDSYGEFFREARRRHPEAGEESAHFGDLTLDYHQQVLYRDGEAVALTASEFIILATLSRSPGITVPAQTLMSAVRGFEWHGDDAALDVHISRLRRKLGEDGRHQRLIRTVRGVGYLFQG